MNIEPLETRIAPATLVNPTTLTFTDIDGDKVTVTTSAGASFVFTNPPNGTAFADTFVFTAPNAIGGQQLQLIDLRQGSGYQGADLTVSVVKAGAGDGLAAVGLILAPGIDLGVVSVKGDLGEIDCGDMNTATPGLELLSVRSMGRYGDLTDALIPGLTSDIKGALGALRVTADIKDARIILTADVGSDAKIGSVTIGGSLIGGTVGGSGSIITSGGVGPVKIGGDMVGGDGNFSGRFSILGGLASLSIGGSLVGGSGPSSGSLRVEGPVGFIEIGGNLQGGSSDRAGFIDAGKLGAVTIGGSMLGGAGESSGRILSDGDIGPVKIAHDVKGGEGNESGKIDSFGKIGTIRIGGSLLGGGGDYNTISSGGIDHRAQIFAVGDIGHVSIAHDLAGGAGAASGGIRTAGDLAGLTIGGSILGGSESDSARIVTAGSIGPVKIGHDLAGGTGQNSGSITAGGALTSATIGGSLIGGPSIGTGTIFISGVVGAVKIGHDVLGGSGNESGLIRSGLRMSSVSIGGSLIGGRGAASGEIFAGEEIGSVRIGHDLVGPSLEAGAIKSLIQSGVILSGGRIGSITIGGSIIAGTDASATAGIFNSATIRADGDIGSLTVKGGLIGNAGPGGESFIVISAQGQAEPRGASDLAIGRIAIGDRVEFAQIFAGYDTSLVAANADAQIGSVTIGGDWIASSIVAGAINLGADDAPGGAGADADNIRFGDSHDFKITGGTDTPNRFSKIGRISIAGQVFGTPVSFSDTDRFGLVAEEIGALKIGGTTFSLEPGRNNDGRFLGRTGDATLHEIGAAFLVSPAPIASATLVNASTVTYEDIDGDLVTVKLSRPLLTAGNVNAVFNFNTGLVNDGVPARQQLRTLDLKPLASDGLGVTITVKPGGGDGLANIGYLDSTGFDLGAVTIPGDLGQIDAGNPSAGGLAIKTLAVRTLGRLGTDTQENGVFIPSLESNLAGALGSLTVRADFKDATLRVLALLPADASIGSVKIGGSLIGGAAFFSGAIVNSGAIGAVKIGQHVQRGVIDAGTSIASFTLGGSLIGGNINADGTTFGAVKIGHNVLGGTGDFSGRISANTGVGNVTIGGSLIGGLGNSSGQIFSAAGGIGAVKIGHNVAGSASNDAGKIDSAAKIASVTIRGSLVGGNGEQDTGPHDGQIFAGGDIGAVRVGHDVRGGAGNLGGAIRAGGDLAGVTIGGSLVGGSGSGAGGLVSNSELATVRIAHNILGGSAGSTGHISALNLGDVTIGGSLVGAGGNGSAQINGTVSMGAVKIGHDVLGGRASGSGYIVGDGAIASVTIGGSLVGGSALHTGGIFPTELGSVKIGRDLIGGSIAGTSITLERSGFIQAQNRIGNVSVGGSIIAGFDDSTGGALLTNASIRAGHDLGALTVKGSLIGNVSPNGTSLVVISARGEAAPVGGKDVAIGKITVGGSVERANILAGYTTALVASNDGVQIGAVRVGHHWIASNLVAGVQNLGADALPGGTGAATDNVNFGDSADASIGTGGVANRIASIVIRGVVVGSAESGDHFGFVAGVIGSFKSLNFIAPLTPGASGDLAELSRITGDVTLREI